MKLENSIGWTDEQIRIAVAELCGWKWINNMGAWFASPKHAAIYLPSALCQRPDRKFRKRGWIEGYVFMDAFPHYTTSISDAFEVVEKMKSNGWSYILTKVSCMFWTCSPCPDNEARGANEKESICLAALRAVGVEVKE